MTFPKDSNVARVLNDSNFDVGTLRPWLENGRSWVTLKDGSVVPHQRDFKATLTKGQWADVDAAAKKAFDLRTPVARAVAEANSFGGFNGLAKMVLESEPTVKTETTQENEDDCDPKSKPVFQLMALPLPITHSDYKPDEAWWRDREVRGDRTVDLTGFEIMGRRVGERVEQTFLHGWDAEVQGCQVYGLTNAKGVKLADSVGGAINALKNIYSPTSGKECGYYGPFIVVAPNPNDPRKQREIENEYLSVYGITRVVFTAETRRPILFQATPDVIRAVIGQELVVVQWDAETFKTLCIFVPQIRSDFYGNTGICLIDNPDEAVVSMTGI